MYFFPLLKLMLDELGRHYGNASCNEFNLAAIFPDRDARHDLMKKVLALPGVLEPYNPNDNYVTVNDHDLLNWIKDRVNELEKLLSNPPNFP